MKWIRLRYPLDVVICCVGRMSDFIGYGGFIDWWLYFLSHLECSIGDIRNKLFFSYFILIQT